MFDSSSLVHVTNETHGYSKSKFTSASQRCYNLDKFSQISRIKQTTHFNALAELMCSFWTGLPQNALNPKHPSLLLAVAYGRR